MCIYVQKLKNNMKNWLHLPKVTKTALGPLGIKRLPPIIVEITYTTIKEICKPSIFMNFGMKNFTLRNNWIINSSTVLYTS
jgi:hypothetical protein